MRSCTTTKNAHVQSRYFGRLVEKPNRTLHSLFAQSLLKFQFATLRTRKRTQNTTQNTQHKNHLTSASDQRCGEGPLCTFSEVAFSRQSPSTTPPVCTPFFILEGFLLFFPRFVNVITSVQVAPRALRYVFQPNIFFTDVWLRWDNDFHPPKCSYVYRGQLGWGTRPPAGAGAVAHQLHL